MQTDRKSIVDAICEFKLTFNQYYLLQIVYNSDTNLLYQVNETGVPFKRNELQDLVDRGYIKNERRDGEFYIDEFSPVISKCKEIFGPLESLGQEFWDAYPDDMYIQGRPVSTKSIDKEEFILNYDRKISKPKHLKILNAVEYEKRIGVRMGIEKWFKSEQWVEIEKKQTSNSTTKPGDHVFKH